MWEEFHECINKRKYITYILCKHCKKIYSHPNYIRKVEDIDNTRSYLDNYIVYIKKRDQKKLIDFVSRMEMNQIIMNDYDNDVIMDKVLKFFISGNITFN